MRYILTLILFALASPAMADGMPVTSADGSAVTSAAGPVLTGGALIEPDGHGRERGERSSESEGRGECDHGDNSAY